MCFLSINRNYKGFVIEYSFDKYVQDDNGYIAYKNDKVYADDFIEAKTKKEIISKIDAIVDIKEL